MIVEQYRRFTLNLTGSPKENPYLETTLSCTLTHPAMTKTVFGFARGGEAYTLRFLPPLPGEWRYTTHSNDPLLDGITGTFTCTPAGGENHGPVCVRSAVAENPTPENRFHFCYADRTRFQPFGTTCYAWIHQPEAVREQTLQTLAKAPFNKIRMCIFPKYYTYNTTDPECYPFVGSREAGFDFTRFDEAFWQKLEDCLDRLAALGIEADLILFHPYDRWGFATMTPQQDRFYLTYAVRRLASFANVWWSLANEYDLMPQKSPADWDDFAGIIAQNDPWGHLCSIHNCLTLFDYAKPWATHCSIQRVDVYKTAENVTEWRTRYQKPVVVDECAYEGNINYGWGNLTGEELTRRFWEGCIRGGYLTHGETFVDRGEQVWWSHGGTLTGESPARIAFLRKLLAEAPADLTPLALTPENHAENWDVPCAHAGDRFFLYYFGFMRPCFRTYRLPAGAAYRIELIDTWQMTVQTLPGTYQGEIRLELPARPWIAVRMTKV